MHSRNQGCLPRSAELSHLKSIWNQLSLLCGNAAARNVVIWVNSVSIHSSVDGGMVVGVDENQTAVFRPESDFCLCRKCGCRFVLVRISHYDLLARPTELLPSTNRERFLGLCRQIRVNVLSLFRLWQVCFAVRCSNRISFSPRLDGFQWSLVNNPSTLFVGKTPQFENAEYPLNVASA